MAKNRREPSVVAIMSNYNGASIFYKGRNILDVSISSLKTTDYKNMRIILADDSSPDNSRAAVRHFKDVEFILNKPNGGLARNTNNAIVYAMKKHNPDYFLILSNDILITDRHWLTKLIETAESDKRIGLVGCKYLNPDGTIQSTWANFGVVKGDMRFDDKSIREVDIVGIVALLMTKEVIKKVGYFDEHLWQSSEDVDYCMVAKKAGFKIMYDGRVNVKHLESLTTKLLVKKSGKDVMFPRWQTSYAYFAFKHYRSFERIRALILFEIVNSIVGVGAKGIRISNIQFKDRIPWRLAVSIRSIFNGYRIYRHAMPNFNARENSPEFVGSKI